MDSSPHGRSLCPCIRFPAHSQILDAGVRRQWNHRSEETGDFSIERIEENVEAREQRDDDLDDLVESVP
jgi:hypothetical protein